MAEAQGIVATDVIFRTALEAGIRELRLYPYLLDYAFRSLVDDTESARVYGQALVDQAKRWFLRTNVEVVVADGKNQPPYPCVAIRNQGGAEDEATLGDVHYQPAEPDDTQWPALAPLAGASYNQIAGEVALPDDFPLVVVPGMIVVDAEGRQYEIQRQTAAGFALAAGVPLALAGASIRGARPVRAAALRSVKEDETWEVAAIVMGEPGQLTWLWLLLKFVLYRNRERFEARGLEQAQYSFGGVERNDDIAAQPLWHRVATVRLKVMSVWPQAIEDNLLGPSFELDVGKTGIGSDEWIGAGEGTGLRIAV